MTGTVTLDGKPLPEATIVFEPIEKGRPSFGVTNAEGHYQLEFTPGKAGALPGRHQVRISTWEPGYDNGTPHPPKPEVVPASYNQKAGETPEMTREVVGSGTVLNFELKSKAGAIVQPAAAESRTKR